MRKLLDNGADLERTHEPSNGTPLYYAIFQARNEKIKDLLIQRGASLDVAMVKGDAEIKKVQNQLDELKKKLNENTLRRVTALINAKADLNQEDAEGHTELTSAIEYDNSPAARLLLENGASPDRPSNFYSIFPKPHYILR